MEEQTSWAYMSWMLLELSELYVKSLLQFLSPPQTREVKVSSALVESSS